MKNTKAFFGGVFFFLLVALSVAAVDKAVYDQAKFQAFISKITGVLNFDNNTLAVDTSNNRVGIGTATPANPLNIKSSSNEMIRLESTTDSANYQQLISGYNSATNYWQIWGGKNPSNNPFLSMTVNSNLVFHGKNNGFVGIGTNDPAASLHVNDDAGNPNSILRLRNSNSTYKTTLIQLEDYTGAQADGFLGLYHPGSASLSYTALGASTDSRAFGVRYDGVKLSGYDSGYWGYNEDARGFNISSGSSTDPWVLYFDDNYAMAVIEIRFGGYGNAGSVVYGYYHDIVKNNSSTTSLQTGIITPVQSGATITYIYTSDAVTFRLTNNTGQFINGNISIKVTGGGEDTNGNGSGYGIRLVRN
jgi:hypothetical protein